MNQLYVSTFSVSYNLSVLMSLVGKVPFPSVSIYGYIHTVKVLCCEGLL